MKIYTGKGDSGQTSLYGGDRVWKNSPRVEACGMVDELNASLGVVLSHKPSSSVAEILSDIQQQLFILGADLATPPTKKTRIQRIGDRNIEQLESRIDQLDAGLPELKNFILPGGSASGAALHLARTLCRRAERSVITCSRQEEISKASVVFLNRLSDLLFVLAREENRQKGKEEVPWQPTQNSDSQPSNS